MKCLIILTVALMGPAIVAVSQTPETIQPKEEDSGTIARKINGARENSLGMIFVPVKGTDVLFCVWETRVQDYQVFVTDTGRDRKKPPFAQGPTHPAEYVSWEDAKAFCAWLTKKERTEGKIGLTHEYRLPTDAEWSMAVGLGVEQGDTPKEKDDKIKDVYPWGDQWPPPPGAGNYASSLKVDKYEYTSPVGSFAANQFGLYDMGGNVSEWCEDLLSPSNTDRVLRGQSWFFAHEPSILQSSNRSEWDPDSRHFSHGFRCVLAVGGKSSEQP